MDNQIRTEEEQLHYFTQCHEKFLKAVESAGAFKHYFRIAETTVCVIFAGKKMEPVMTPALEHLRINELIQPDLTLCVWDSESTGVEMVPHPCDIPSFTDRGDIWGFYSNRIKTAFHYSDFSINVMDLFKGTGIFWVESANSFPYWVYSSPLRTLIHWWLEKQGCQLLHAAAIGTDQGAVLITGKGGIGKSTAALSCFRAGFFYLSDDYIITKLYPEPKVYSLYNSAKLNFSDLERFCDFSDVVMNPEKRNNDKAVLYLFPKYKKQIINELPLRAIMMPNITERSESSYKPAGFWQIQKALSFTTLSHLPNPGKHTIEYIYDLSNSLPKFILRSGNDLSGIPPVISNCIEDVIKNKIKPVKEDISNKPLITVIIPVYNGAEFIREAIDNILSQNYPAIEIIVINDGSTDQTDAFVKEIDTDIRYFWYGNDGPAFARNRGIRDASGEFIAFLDVDDLWPENNLNILLNEFLNDPEADVVRGYGQVMKKNLLTGEYEPTGDPKKSFPAFIGAALYRKEVFYKVGLFDVSLHFGEDSDWYMRATELNIKMKWVDRVTLKVRRHGKNFTEGKDLIDLNVLKVFKKAIDRARLKQNQ